MKEIKIDKDLVSCCWLYCGECKKYISNNCPGCKKLEKTPFWCTIRDCCLNKGYENCADCEDYPNNAHCKKFNGFVMRTLGYICGSDRFAAIKIIKDKGIEYFAKYMSENNLQRISKK